VKKRTSILGVSAFYHDSAAALVVDGEIVAAAEEERFNRRKHGKPNVPFAAWEMPATTAAWCLRRGGLRPQDVDLVACSFDPALTAAPDQLALDDPWDHLRVEYARRAPVS
jgi:carbamoyltransferase